MAIGHRSATDSARAISIQAPKQKNVPVSTLAKDQMYRARAATAILAIQSLVADRMSDLRWTNNPRQTDPKEITTEVRSHARTKDQDPMTTTTGHLEMKTGLLAPMTQDPAILVAAAEAVVHAPLQVAVAAEAAGVLLRPAKAAKRC